MEWVAGLDAGGEGGLVLMSRSRLTQVYRFDQQSYKAIFDQIKYHAVVRSFMERANERPGEAYQFAWGRNYGKAELLCDFLPWQTEMIEAKAWQYPFNLGGKHGPPSCQHEGGTPYKCCTDCEYSARKRAHKAHCQELFPEEKVTLKCCDARLIAELAWRLTWGNVDEFKKKPARVGTGIVRTVTRIRGNWDGGSP